MSPWISPKNAKSWYWMEPHKKSRTCVIAVLTYIRGNGHINSLVSPLGPGRPYGTRVRPPKSDIWRIWKVPKKRFSENPPKITKTCVSADFAYIVPWNEYCDRPWPLIFSGRRGPHRSLSISPKNAKSWYWIEPHKKSRTCVIAVFEYIVPLDRVYQRPLSPGSARPYGGLWNPRHLLEKSTGECTIWSQNKI